MLMHIQNNFTDTYYIVPCRILHGRHLLAITEFPEEVRSFYDDIAENIRILVTKKSKTDVKNNSKLNIEFLNL